MMPILTRSLTHKIEQMEVAVLESRLKAIESIPGNPMQVEIRRFGKAVVFTAKQIPGPAFNTVRGLHGEDSEKVEAILSYFQDREIPAQFELIPAFVSPDLLKLLTERGYRLSKYHRTLYGACEEASPIYYPRIDIQRLGKNDFHTFAAIYTKAFQMPDFLTDAVAQNNAVLYDVPGWNFFLASIEQEPAGIGVLFMKNGIAEMAAAATLPKFRNRGVHQALIQKRIEHAIFSNCHLLVGQATDQSVSQFNMEKAGMGLAYMREIWQKSD